MTPQSTKTTSKVHAALAQVEIRPIAASDYERVSNVISRCLTEVNVEITLRSSLTSKAFYESLQYHTHGSTYGAVGGQMILMTKKL